MTQGLLARKTGLEPATLGVTGRYSNQLSYFRATNCGVPTGIRTPVIAVKGRCPRPLDDGDVDTAWAVSTVLLTGGGMRDRTADLLHAMQALSQLSYTPERFAVQQEQGRTIQTFSADCKAFLKFPASGLQPADLMATKW